MEVLKKRLEETWGPYNVQLEAVQVLPKAYYLFLFKDKEMALHILRADQWNSGILRFASFDGLEFNPSDQKPTTYPV